MYVVLVVAAFLVGALLVTYGSLQAILFYYCRRWYDHQIKRDVASLARAEVERILGKFPGPFVHRRALQWLSHYSGQYAAAYVRSTITRFARIGLLVAMVGVALCIGSFHISVIFQWVAQVFAT